MNKVLVSLNNGIGDLIITFPIVNHLLSLGYDITYETVSYNFDLIEYFFDKRIKCIEYTNSSDPYKRHNGLYNFVVNLNNMYLLNDISHYYYKDDHAKRLNRQILANFLFINSYLLDIPKDLDMSRHFDILKVPNDNILFFTHSRSAENRKIYYELVCELENHYKDNKNIILNPTYNNLKELCENINNAKLVVTVDTGTLHIAEILKTNWIGLFTNQSEDVLTKYYKYGKQIIRSTVPCAPCNYHGGGCTRNKNKEFNCIYGFDLNTIVDTVHKIINY